MDFIQYEVKDKVAVISLNRPERRNAQNQQLLVELDEAWQRAADDKEVHVILLRANGPHFSAGHEVSRDGSSSERVAAIHDDVRENGLLNYYQWEAKHFLGFCRKWRDVPKPSIAAVQGACIAAGLMLCWPCDLIVAADNAWFSDPVVLMGIGGVEYHGHTWEFGARKAKELLFTAEAIDAAQAERLGMVNRVVPLAELDEAAMALARKIAGMPPFGVMMAKRAVNQTLDTMGQYAALQSAFDAHQLGHGSAFAQSGKLVLAWLDDIRRSQKKDSSEGNA